MTQEEFDMKYKADKYGYWRETWRIVLVNTNVSDRPIRCIAIDGELFYVVLDIADRLGFNSTGTLTKYFTDDECPRIKGISTTVYAAMDRDVDSDTIRTHLATLSCVRMVNKHGIANIVDKLRVTKRLPGMRDEFNIADIRKFGDWLLSRGIPNAEEKLQALPELKIDPKRRFTPPDDIQEEQTPLTRPIPTPPYTKEELMKVADYVDAEAKAIVLANPEVNKYGAPILQLMAKFFVYGLDGELPPSWEEYVKILNPEYQRYLEVKTEYMKLKEQFEPAVKKPDPTNINAVKQKLQNIAKVG